MVKPCKVFFGPPKSGAVPDAQRQGAGRPPLLIESTLPGVPPWLLCNRVKTMENMENENHGE